MGRRLLVRLWALFLLPVLGAPAWSHPAYNIAADRAGNVYFLDWPERRVMKVTPKGVLTQLASLAGLTESHPHALALDAGGNVLVAATYESRLWTITPRGVIRKARLAQEVGGAHVLNLAFDPQQRLCLLLTSYRVAENGTFRDRRWRFLRTAARDAPAKEIFACREGGAGYLDLYAGSFAAGKGGAVYVTHRNRVLALAGGKVRVLAGSQESGFADGVGAAARFSAPWGLWRAADGRLLVADSGNGRLREVSVDGVDGKVRTLAGSGQRGGRDGPALTARFDGPYAVCGDGSGRIFVAEYAHPKSGPLQRIRVLEDGTVRTLATLRSR